ncbi:MAG TPA: bifunctional DNA-formamidopyrimidine glycosylase/DNA-(apurinic or apyrimidinic site) lyase [Gemmatimonadaceae bacterium]|nr:bifunctional DNA-formamidopyrimidine glycosylase/DNA-(apurinic or apyrimidinic site) lyase [Gemmatimonadaceae bacterium]
MPELPEVERAARRLRRAVVGRVIREVRALHFAIERALPGAEARSLAGHTITAVRQQAKHQLLELDDGRAIHGHFRMAGDWSIGRADAGPPRHARAVIDLDDGTRVSLVDPRALSSLRVVAAGSDAFPGLGPDPFSPRFDDSLAAALARRRIAIKPALLDQRVAAGVGNIYAAEALWEARIDPRVPARSLDVRQVAALAEAIRTVLRRARSSRGRYTDGGQRFRVYDREGKACPRCGSPIARLVQAGRSTYWCPECQRAPGRGGRSRAAGRKRSRPPSRSPRAARP